VASASQPLGDENRLRGDSSILGPGNAGSERKGPESGLGRALAIHDLCGGPRGELLFHRLLAGDPGRVPHRGAAGAGCGPAAWGKVLLVGAEGRAKIHFCHVAASRKEPMRQGRGAGLEFRTAAFANRGVAGASALRCPRRPSRFTGNARPRGRRSPCGTSRKPCDIAACRNFLARIDPPVGPLICGNGADLRLRGRVSALTKGLGSGRGGRIGESGGADEGCPSSLSRAHGLVCPGPTRFRETRISGRKLTR